MERQVLHVDCNKFYASVECLHHPEIRSFPVAVGGDPENRHGIILTANDMARATGVQTGESLWQARQKCPGLVVVPPNFSLYQRFSGLVRKILSDYSDYIEPFGLDESWVDVTGCLGYSNPAQIGEEIRRRVKEELGITVSIGVSFNKIFAKLGSDYKKPDAVTVISRENFRNIVWPLPVTDLLYVGRATGRKLRERNIRTIGQLACIPLENLKILLGSEKIAFLLHSYANGLEHQPVAKWEEAEQIKSIGNSTTTPRDLTTPREVELIFLVLADSVARRLRQHKLLGRTISIGLRSTDLHTFTRQKSLDFYTDHAGEIADTAMRIFHENYHMESPLRSVGIQVSDFAREQTGYQLSLEMNEKKRQQLRHLDRTVDDLRRRFGTDCIQQAALLTDRALTGFNPHDNHTVHPVSVLKNKIELLG